MIHKVFSIMSLVVLLPLTAFANPPADETNMADISLTATVNNNPALRTVTWQVYRLGDDNSKPAYIGSRHSMTIKMRPGAYRVTATMDGKQRDKQFTVAPAVNREIEVSMD